MYTDESKDPLTEVSVAAVGMVSRRRSNYLSGYGVELCAVLLALEWVEEIIGRENTHL